MATIFKRLSDREDKKTHRREILIRFKQGNKLDQRAKTGIFIDAKYWHYEELEEQAKTKSGEPIFVDGEPKMKKVTISKFAKITARIQTDETVHHIKANEKLGKLEAHILNAFIDADKSNLPSNWLDNLVDKFNNPMKYTEKPKQVTFFELFDDFLSVRKLSDVRKRNFYVIRRALQRFERYKQIELNIDTFTVETLQNFDKFLREEHTFFSKSESGKFICSPKYKSIFDAVPESRTPQPRGQNTINDVFTKLRTFFLWAVDSGKTKNNPFRKFAVEECVYGTPYYITIDERNQIYTTDLSHRPQLAIQRDIFVFQCLIGCRVGDLYKMTPNNVIDGSIEYVPRKTKEGRPVTVQVPLNGTAREILDRYKETPLEKLLPFISEQKYNAAIKEVFRLAGVVRNVTVRNPTTGESEIKPINDIASSHLARRAFVGNLYKQVKDPNLVGALSGHKEGSKAFSRYRDIDLDMKRSLVELLEKGGQE